jgi:hypothetical protein
MRRQADVKRHEERGGTDHAAQEASMGNHGLA